MGIWSELAYRVQRLVRWLFGAPVQNLPTGFGDTVPPEVAKFEAEFGDERGRLPISEPPLAGAIQTKAVTR